MSSSKLNIWKNLILFSAIKIRFFLSKAYFFDRFFAITYLWSSGVSSRHSTHVHRDHYVTTVNILVRAFTLFRMLLLLQRSQLGNYLFVPVSKYLLIPHLKIHKSPIWSSDYPTSTTEIISILPVRWYGEIFRS